MGFEWVRCSFLLELVAGTFVFSLSMNRKTHFWKRFSIFYACAFGIAGCIPLHPLKFFLEMLLTGIGVYWTYEVSWRKAMYCADCAYALQHFSYSLEAVWYMYTKGRIYHTHAVALQGADFSKEFWICYLIGYGGAFVLLLRQKKRKATYDISTWQVLLFSTGVLGVTLVLSTLVQQYRDEENLHLVLICYLYSMLCCVFIIILEYGVYQGAVLKNEISVIHHLWKKRQEQYITAKENIASINRKCHELKREIFKIQEIESFGMLKSSLEELRREIQIYDAVVKTGNEVLDVVLTEKSLYCTAKKITLACVIDGGQLGFMDAVDIYALFEDGLDYAVRQVENLEDEGKRQIAVTVWAKGGLILIQIENYCGETAYLQELDRQEAGAEYERKSIQYLVGRYGGCMTEHYENAVSIMRISIPIPEKRAGRKGKG